MVRSRDIGSTAEYRCNTNYILQGKRKRTCQANREWSDEEPFCQGIACLSAVSCLYSIISACVGIDWEGCSSPLATGKCDISLCLCLTHSVVQCPELSSPANGLVSVSGLTPGSEASYSCKPGYRLEGSLTRTCLDERVWSSQEPACVGKIQTAISSGNI